MHLLRALACTLMFTPEVMKALVGGTLSDDEMLKLDNTVSALQSCEQRLSCVS